MHPSTDGRGPTGVEMLGATAVATAVFAVFAARWVASIATAVPDAAAWGNTTWGADARLIVWILAWVAHALVTMPSRLFDAPIFHPIPHTLAGSEHLATSVLVSGPVYALTANPVLAANLAAMSTYILAAVVGYALMRSVGLPMAAACVGAAALALGPLQVPADLHVLQYPTWCLALVILAAARLEHGGRLRWLAAAVTLAAFSSYYIAAMTVALVAIESFLAWRTRGRRAAGAILLASAPAFAMLGAISIPYLHGPAAPPSTDAIGIWSEATRRLWGSILDPGSVGLGFGWGVVILSLVALVHPAVRRQAPGVRWWRWLILVVVGAMLATPFTLRIGETTMPMPSLVLGATPLRANHRWILLAHVGLAGLAAESSAAIMRLLAVSAPAARLTPVLLAAALVAVVCVPRARHLADQPLTVLPTGDAVPAVYRWLAAHATGPLLEPPGPQVGNWLAQSDTMLLGTYHWLPLLNGHTGYPPWAYQAMTPEFERLPTRDALQTLVDLTGLEWILVRRARLPAAYFSAWETFARTDDAVRRVPEGDPDLLLRVMLRPRNAWAAALARPRTPAGETALGTPLASLDDSTVRGRVIAIAAPHVRAARKTFVAVTLENAGPRTWPAVVPPGASRVGVVELVVRWRHPDGTVVGEVRHPIPRDVAPGDAAHFRTLVGTPPSPGSYTLEVRVVQDGGATMNDVTMARVPVVAVHDAALRPGAANC